MVTCMHGQLHTEYNRAKVPPCNGNDPPPAPGSLKTLLFPPLFNEMQNKGRKGYKQGTVRNFPHSFPFSGTPVVQSYWAWTNGNCHCPQNTIHTKIITNKNLEICFRIRFRNGKVNKFPQIFFRSSFRNDHVGHAQATIAGHAYEIK